MLAIERRYLRLLRFHIINLNDASSRPLPIKVIGHEEHHHK